MMSYLLDSISLENIKNIFYHIKIDARKEQNKCISKVLFDHKSIYPMKYKRAVKNPLVKQTSYPVK